LVFPSAIFLIVATILCAAVPGVRDESQGAYVCAVHAVRPC
jgi:hypothetical protein